MRIKNLHIVVFVVSFLTSVRVNPGAEVKQ